VGRPLENYFQKKLIQRLKKDYPDAIIQKLDSGYTQGIPDLLILQGSKWAALEAKRSAGESHRPNQDWYVDKMNRMSFSRFVCPENMEEVLRELQAFFAD